MTYNFKCNESPLLTIRWLTTPCNQLNKKEKTEKTHAKNIMVLTTDSLVPLHKEPWQQ